MTENDSPAFQFWHSRVCLCFFLYFLSISGMPLCGSRKFFMTQFGLQSRISLATLNQIFVLINYKWHSSSSFSSSLHGLGNTILHTHFIFSIVFLGCRRPPGLICIISFGIISCNSVQMVYPVLSELFDFILYWLYYNFLVNVFILNIAQCSLCWMYCI